MLLKDTTRPMAATEVDGCDYHFVSKSDFQSRVNEGSFVEFGEFEKYQFGTSIEAIRDVVNSGKVCILNFHPQVCDVLLLFCYR